MTKTIISGPFGSYDYDSMGGVLNSLYKEGVPLNTVERVTVDFKNKVIKDGEVEFAKFKFFENIEKPLFCFQSQNYHRQSSMFDHDDKLKPNFKLCMYVHGSASLVISKVEDSRLFTRELYYFIKKIMAANVSHIDEDSPAWMKESNEMYELKNNAGAYFQGGSDSFEDEYIYIEFHKPAGAQAFVDYVNENFTYEGVVRPPVMPMDF